MKKLAIVFLLTGIFYTSCKKPVSGDTGVVKQEITSEPQEEETKNTRIAIGTTAASIETKYPWEYSIKDSELSVSEKLHYVKKETFQRVDASGTYVILSRNVAKDGIDLSLQGGLEGALKNMALSANTEITGRKDADKTSHYGFPAVMSSGVLASKNNAHPDVTYRLLLLIDGQELYFVLGLFTTPGSQKTEEFEQELHSLTITKT